MARVKQQKTRQMLLVTTGPLIDPFVLPEKLQLFYANGDSADLSNFIGLPEGGNTGRILAKLSAVDYDVGWITPPAGGGGFTIFEQLTEPVDAPIGSIWIEQEPEDELDSYPGGSSMFEQLTEPVDAPIGSVWIEQEELA